MIRTITFSIAIALTSVVACIKTHDLGIQPYAGMPVLIDGMTAALLGGMDSPWGPLVGGVAVGLLKNLVVWQTSAQWEPALSLGLLMVMLIVKPSGLAAYTERYA
jgi:branched-chain amino acid transport system permease protein